MAVEVAGELLFLTDALLHPLQGARPEWGHGLDRRPGPGGCDHHAPRLLDRAVRNGLPVACSHVEGVFRVEPADAAFRLTRA